MKCPGCLEEVSRLIPFEGQEICSDCVEDAADAMEVAENRRSGRDEEDWR